MGKFETFTLRCTTNTSVEQQVSQSLAVWLHCPSVDGELYLRLRWQLSRLSDAPFSFCAFED